MSPISGRKTPIIVALMTTLFLISIEVTIVSTAMPHIVKDLGGLQSMSWIFSAYLLTTVVSTPIFGKLLDLYGRKKIYLFGLIVFVLASACSGFSQTMLQLILFRAVQGLGAGALFPSVMTVTGTLFSQEERAKIQAGFSAVGAVSGLAGPYVGGLFVDHLTWQWIFFLNVPIGLVCLLMFHFSYLERLERGKISIDVPGALLFTAASTCLLLYFTSVNTTLLACSFALYAVFLFVERKKAESALVPLGLFSNRALSLGFLATFLLSTLYIGMNVYIPMWMQGGAGSNATDAGLTLAPMSVMWSVGAYLCGVWLGKKGSRFVCLSGMVLITAGVVMLAALGSVPVTEWIVAAMVLVGSGMGLTTTAVMVAIQSEAKPSQLGSAMATLTFLNYMAQSIGISFFASVFNRSALKGTEELRNQGLEIQNLNALLQFRHVGSASDTVRNAIRTVIAESVSGIFFYILAFVVLAFAVVWFFRSQPPENRAGAGRELAEAADQ
ncbi:MDR family MFS transporter [Cohnella caldifontis]|uniref:MDR family MFS transporter n=1 Tax=Cohnella caldifontis TaxID=3027471 RepID=UPI0023EDAB5F|nr:MDR family MFS transporter [Cohnella sp. YIM B05605]